MHAPTIPMSMHAQQFRITAKLFRAKIAQSLRRPHTQRRVHSSPWRESHFSSSPVSGDGQFVRGGEMSKRSDGVYGRLPLQVSLASRV